MVNYIEHGSFVELYNKNQSLFDRIFNNCKTLNTVIRRMQKESKEYVKYGYTEDQGKAKMIGDLYEIFAEMFFKIMGANPKIGVYGYKVEGENDNGVDGYGIGIDGNPCTVQVKFRSNNQKDMVSGELKNFHGQSISQLGKYKVPADTKTNIIVFTSAKGLHWYSKNEVLLGQVRTIDFEGTRKYVDNNIPFWMMCQDYIEDSVKEYYG